MVNWWWRWRGRRRGAWWWASPSAYSLRRDAKVLTAAPAAALETAKNTAACAVRKCVPQGLTALRFAAMRREPCHTHLSRAIIPRPIVLHPAPPKCYRARRLAAVVKVATSTQSISTRRRCMFSFPIVRRRAWRSPRPSTRSVAPRRCATVRRVLGHGCRLLHVGRQVRGRRRPPSRRQRERSRAAQVGRLAGR